MQTINYCNPIKVEGGYLCPFCEKFSRVSGDMIRHIRTHTKEKPFKCDQCTYACSQSCNLKRHKEKHHYWKIIPFFFLNKIEHFPLYFLQAVSPVKVEGGFCCPFCEKFMKGSRDMKRHIRTHTRENPYKCDLCSYSCSRPDSLKLHCNKRHWQ